MKDCLSLLFIGWDIKFLFIEIVCIDKTSLVSSNSEVKSFKCVKKKIIQISIQHIWNIKSFECVLKMACFRGESQKKRARKSAHVLVSLRTLFEEWWCCSLRAICLYTPTRTSSTLWLIPEGYEFKGSENKML